MKQKKDGRLSVRITRELSDWLEEEGLAQGFSGKTEYARWLIKNEFLRQMEEEKKMREAMIVDLNTPDEPAIFKIAENPSPYDAKPKGK